MHCPIIFTDSAQAAGAASLADQLRLPLLGMVDPRQVQEVRFVLQLTPAGLQLQHTGPKAPGPVWVNFTGGSADHRRQFGGGRGQMVAKAVGLKSGVCPLVFDATAGLGGDAFVLASLGACVLLQERNPIVHALLADGLARLAADPRPALQDVSRRLRLLPNQTDSTQTMMAADVVYLDPMFPVRGKQAAVKKEMAAFHELVGEDADQDALLAAAQSAARYRVVVKRPRKAPCLADSPPPLTLAGKSSRFDIYPLKKLPEPLAPNWPSL